LQCFTARPTSIREEPCSGIGRGTKHTVMFIKFLSFSWRIFKLHPRNTYDIFVNCNWVDNRWQ
jgi:hypothetical protein